MIDLSGKQIAYGGAAVILGGIAFMLMPYKDQVQREKENALIAAFLEPAKVAQLADLEATCANKTVNVTERKNACNTALLDRGLWLQWAKTRQENPNWRDDVNTMIRSAADKNSRCKLNVRNTQPTVAYAFMDHQCDVTFAQDMREAKMRYGADTPAPPRY